MEITIINLRSERLCERFDEEVFEELEISGLSRPLQKIILNLQESPDCSEDMEWDYAAGLVL